MTLYIRQFPNVVGSVGNFLTQNAPSVYSSGAFKSKQFGDTAKGEMISDAGVNDAFDFDASWSSAIYKSISKISVRSIQLLMIIKV